MEGENKDCSSNSNNDSDNNDKHDNKNANDKNTNSNSVSKPELEKPVPSEPSEAVRLAVSTASRSGGLVSAKALEARTRACRFEKFCAVIHGSKRWASTKWASKNRDQWIRTCRPPSCRPNHAADFESRSTSVATCNVL